MTNRRWVKKNKYIRKLNGKVIIVSAHSQRYSNDSQPKGNTWKRHGVIDYSLESDGSLKAIRLSQEQAESLSRGIIIDFNQRNSKFAFTKEIGKQKLRDTQQKFKQKSIQLQNFSKRRAIHDPSRKQFISNTSNLNSQPSNVEVPPKDDRFWLRRGISVQLGGKAPESLYELSVAEFSDFIPIISSISGLRRLIKSKRNKGLYVIEVIPFVNMLPTDTLIYIKDRKLRKDINLQRIKQKSRSQRRSQVAVNSDFCPSCGNADPLCFQKRHGIFVCFACRKGSVPTTNFKSFVQRSNLPGNIKQRLQSFSVLVDNSNILQSNNQQNWARVHYYNTRFRNDRLQDSNRDEKQVKDFYTWNQTPNELDMRYVDDKLPKSLKFYREINKNGPLSLISIRDKNNRNLSWIDFVYRDNLITLIGSFQANPGERNSVPNKVKLYDLKIYILREIVNLADVKRIDIRSENLELSKLLKTFGSNITGEGLSINRVPHI